MSIFLRIWLPFALVLFVGSVFTLYTLQSQIKPSVRQVVEDTLADNANIIAHLIAPDVANKSVQSPEFDQKIRQILHRKFNAKIWSQQKSSINQQLYITNSQGIVIYDSRGLATGQDYSRWNDVYLTLQGRYGVRSTRSNPNDPNTSTMFVAAPIIWKDSLIGVLSLAKPSTSVQPYIDHAQAEMTLQAIWIVSLFLLICGLVAWWLRHSIERVRRYAMYLTPNHASSASNITNITKPLHFWAARELNELTQAIDQMHTALAGKEYVENYVHSLTHELKSPLTAIAASAELLQDDLPLADRLAFTQNIHEQTQRLQQLIERLLLLAKLEKQQDRRVHKIDKKQILLVAQIEQLLQERRAVIKTRQLQIDIDIAPNLALQAEPFWFNQAVGNLLDNAIDFTPHGKCIRIHAEAITAQHNPLLFQPSIMLQIENDGEIIPEYALPHVFDRYFSLPRPNTARKSTGIGLTLVREVMILHQGNIQIENTENGVSVSLFFS